MIKYQVFNPIDGAYTQVDTLDAATALRDTFKTNYLDFQNVGKVFSEYVYEEHTQDKNVATEFIAVKQGISEVGYLYSTYNATTKQISSRVYTAENYLIKVSGGAVTEWYERDGTYQGAQHLFVALDVVTDAPIEYYDYVDGVTKKYLLDGTFVVDTVSCAYDTLSNDQKLSLADFRFKTMVYTYSNKTYGEVYEFREVINTPYAECSEQQKAVLDAKKQAFLAENEHVFVITKETIKENGDTTWEPL